MGIPRPEDIIGTWTLESFELEDFDEATKSNASPRPWGKNVTGLLIYSESGQMSVGINKDIENDPTQSEAENRFDATLFYSGPWQFDGEVIRHQVTNASNPTRIGREMLRYPKLSGDLLTLVTPQESWGRAILKWKKVRR